MTGAISVAQTSPRLDNDSRLLAAREMIRNDDLQGLQSLEAKILNSTDSDAQRKGAELILRLKSGTEKVYTNSPECTTLKAEANCKKYALIAHFNSMKMFVLAKLYNESAEYLLIDDQTGSETVLRAFPHFSPSGKHLLLLIMNDDQYGFAIQMWRREGEAFVLDWSGSPYTEGIYTSYELVRWSVENTVVLTADVSFEPPKYNSTRRFTLVHSTSGWNIVGAR